MKFSGKKRKSVVLLQIKEIMKMDGFWGTDALNSCCNTNVSFQSHLEFSLKLMAGTGPPWLGPGDLTDCPATLLLLACTSGTWLPHQLSNAPLHVLWGPFARPHGAGCCFLHLKLNSGLTLYVFSLYVSFAEYMINASVCYLPLDWMAGSTRQALGFDHCFCYRTPVFVK